MKSDWQEKIGVGERQNRYGKHAGSAQEIPIYREDDGKLGGKQTKHWDGREDATIIAPTLVKDAVTGEIRSES